jgi:hypothetical protein
MNLGAQTNLPQMRLKCGVHSDASQMPLMQMSLMQIPLMQTPLKNECVSVPIRLGL